MPNTFTVAPQAVDQDDIAVFAERLRRREYAQAEAWARELGARQPSCGFAWQALGLALSAQGRWADAVDAQRHAAELAPDDAAIHRQWGDSLMGMQAFTAAAASYRRARALAPEQAENSFKLGNALAVLSHLNDAADCYRRALELQPDFNEAQANLGFTLMSAGQYAEAELPLRQALAKRADNVPLHNSLGVVLYALDRGAEAEVHFRRVTRLAPAYAEGHANLGNALRQQQYYAEAEASYQQALALSQDFARAHFELAGLWVIQERFAEAEQGYRRALAFKPDYVEASNNLGRCIRKQGRLEEARDCFESTLTIDPNYVDAYCNLAPLRRFTPDDPHSARLEALADRLPGLDEMLQIRYHFALAKMYEDSSRYDEAFSAYAQGNRMKWAKLAPDESVRKNLIDSVRSVFDAAFFARHAATGSDQKTDPRVPIFIVGMPRSGTSLLEQILSSHPSVHGAGELHELDNMLFAPRQDATAPARDYPHYVDALRIDALRHLGQTYLDQVWQQAPQARYITDKMMSNFLHLGMIHLMLPQAKIVHAMRDPMDSCFSCYANLFSKNNLDFTYELGSVGRYYVRYMELMQHWRQVLPAGTMLELSYESMVADMEGQSRRLLDYLGLPWDARCLDFHTNQRIVLTASAAQVRRPIYRSSVARWRRFESQLAPLLEIVRPWRLTPEAPASD